ncbi:MAG: hypothetical protein ACI9VT_003230, partial [Psychroserpens sp.]
NHNLKVNMNKIYQIVQRGKNEFTT